MTIMMLVMAFFLGFRHPRDRRRGRRRSTPARKLVAAFALVIFILCFTPVPIEIVLGDQ